jgi:hypothetical protein
VLRQLSRHYLDAGDAAGLLKVLKCQLALDPEDPVVANNFAYASFLLGRNLLAAKKSVDDLCARFPNAQGFAATRAFGLLVGGDVTAARECLERFPVDRLRGTPQGVTYGLVLAASGEADAGGFLKDATRLAHFPEERNLIAKWTARIPQ